MKAKNKNLKRLRKSACDKLVAIQPSRVQRDKFRPTFLHFDGYLDLFITIEALINVSILATQGDTYSPSRIKDPEMDIRRTLELANQLLPFEEGEFLDEAYRVFVKTP